MGIWAKLNELRQLDNQRISPLVDGEPVVFSLVAYQGAPPPLSAGGLNTQLPVAVFSLIYLAVRSSRRRARGEPVRSERCGLAVTSTRVVVLELDRRSRPRRITQELRGCDLVVGDSTLHWTSVDLCGEAFWVLKPYVPAVRSALAACSPASSGRSAPTR